MMGLLEPFANMVISLNAACLKEAYEEDIGMKTFILYYGQTN